MDELSIEWVNWKLSGRFANQVGELQIKWENWKIEWTICKSSGRIAKLNGRIASHTPLRKLADFAPTTEPKTTIYQWNKSEKYLNQTSFILWKQMFYTFQETPAKDRYEWNTPTSKGNYCSLISAHWLLFTDYWIRLWENFILFRL